MATRLRNDRLTASPPPGSSPAGSARDRRNSRRFAAVRMFSRLALPGSAFSPVNPVTGSASDRDASSPVFCASESNPPAASSTCSSNRRRAPAVSRVSSSSAGHSILRSKNQEISRSVIAPRVRPRGHSSSAAKADASARSRRVRRRTPRNSRISARCRREVRLGPQPAIQIVRPASLSPSASCSGHTRRQIVRRFQKPAGLAVVHELHRRGQPRPRMLRREKTLFGNAQPPPAGRVRQT